MSPRSRKAIEVLHDERRKKILDAALGAFVEKGFEGTRIQEIARRCNLSYGLVYHYFPTKEAVFATLVDMALAGAMSLIQSMPVHASPEALGAFVGFAISDPSPHYFALIVEALTKRGVSPELAAKARHTILNLKDSFVPAGESSIKSDFDEKGEGILALLLGASVMKLCGVSDGDFASRAAMKLAVPDGE